MLHPALMSQRVNWVLDADIRRFSDSVDHEWLLRMVAHRIADRRALGLIREWLEAGVLENGTWYETVAGTPQGAGISPLLANVFLHYALDLWVHRWRRGRARGRVIIVRYADDFVMGVQYAQDARRMLGDLRERLTQFGLQLHGEKTRLIEFGRLPALDRKRRGAPESPPTSASAELPAGRTDLMRLPLAPIVPTPRMPREVNGPRTTARRVYAGGGVTASPDRTVRQSSIAAA